MTLTLTPAAFRERFALATFSDGGVVVDLETGSYSRLNAAGAVVLEELERAEGIEGAVEAIGRRLGLNENSAQEYLASVTSGLAREGLRNEPPEPFRYRQAADGGYEVWHDAVFVLHVDAGGRQVTLASDPVALPLRPYDYVSGIAPKLLFLRGVTVLHGSSCLERESLLAICGRSGAGKTTTAKTLARHGHRLFSEDLLLLGPNLSAPAAFVDGERRVDQWSRNAARTLATKMSTANTDDLLSVASGPSRQLGSLWFLDVGRRGEAFRRRKLSQADALAQVMTHHFLGAGGASSWRRHLAVSRAIAAAVAAYELDLPRGLDRLDGEIGRYTENSAS